MRTKLRMVVLGFIAPFVISAALLTAAGPASADVLVHKPRNQVCKGKYFRVGVWNNYEGGPRRYRINVFNPAGKRVFHRHGKATHTWKFWRIKAKRLGRYRVVYRSGKGVKHPWRVRFFVRSHRC